MHNKNTRAILGLMVFSIFTFAVKAEDEKPFGPDFPNLDNAATDGWWERTFKQDYLKLDVPRNQVVGFTLYTHDNGTLKVSAQFFPLKPGEDRVSHLELFLDDKWMRVQSQPIIETGWSSHFRIDNWDNSKNVKYRVRHGSEAEFGGIIRKDPVDKKVIVVANLSCNSGRTGGPRPRIIENLLHQDPDLLFFAGDQTYHHTQHTAGWLEFGMQFRDIIKDRPTISIPDDHDVGQANIWGENGKKASSAAGPDGGFYYPVKYVNMVQRCQTWHLPDPFDSTPIDRDISVYYTRLRVGGIDFAIIEDRKFKSGPKGKIPKMGPRPDHINDPSYDRSAIDLPNLKLLGDRQLDFLNTWNQDWTGANMKAVLSQTAFCGAVHLHGNPNNRLLADLDSNGWPQRGRNKALEAIRRAWAPHLCGDQHLSVVVKHGIDDHQDGPYGFTSPAIVNTIYGRWWHPEDEKPGPNPVKNSPLPWTGDYEDGLGNKIHMMAYANPEDRSNELKRADGYGIARFNKKEKTITFEAWPRFSDAKKGDKEQFSGWPITVSMKDNDGRTPTHYLPQLRFKKVSNPVVQVSHPESGEILYTVRVSGKSFRPHVFKEGHYTISVGHDKPNKVTWNNVPASPMPRKAGNLVVDF